MNFKKYLFLFFLLVAFCLTNKTEGQSIRGTIILLNEPVPFTPKEFFITAVTDERSEKDIVAKIIVKSKRNIYQVNKTDMNRGAQAAIKHFIDHNIPYNTTLIPVVVRLKRFELIENPLPDGSIAGRLSVSIAFDRHFDNYDTHLIDYNGNINYIRPIEQEMAPESIIRRGLENALAYFNKWINQEADSNVKLAKKAIVNFTDYMEITDTDTLYYNKGRPLTWLDFKGKPENNHFEAEVFASIGYSEQVEVIKGVIVINMGMKTYLSKTDCWVKEGAKTFTVLNHEQKHFDIAKIVTEHFKQKILSVKLPVDNYDGPINIEYLEALRELDALQKQYDMETQHGTNQILQRKWDIQISNWLNVK